MRLFNQQVLGVVENDSNILISNSAAEIELLFAAEVIPGGTLPSFNRCEISLIGNLSQNVAAIRSVTWRYKLNATTEATFTVNIPASAGDRGFEARFVICNRFVAGGVDGLASFRTGGAIVTTPGTDNVQERDFADGAINTALDITPHITAQWNAASASSTIESLHYQYVMFIDSL